MSEIRQHVTTVQLACGCDAIFNPAPYAGDVVYCQKCRVYKRVTSGGTDRIWSHVLCEKCRYARKYRHVEEKVLHIRADTHAIKTGHVVRVINKQGKISYRTAT